MTTGVAGTRLPPLVLAGLLATWLTAETPRRPRSALAAAIVLCGVALLLPQRRAAARSA